MAYAWKKEWETGNATIDSQHKELIKAINDLLEACAVGRGRNQIKNTSKFLLDYTKTHFSDEQKLQLKYGYPDYANHKKYHDTFVQVVKDINDELEKEGPTLVLVGKINTAIAGWLINHITKEDVKVAKHIREHM